MSAPTIASLRHRLVLEEATRTPDGAGGGVETWSTVAELWADLHPMSGREVSHAEQLSGRLTHRVIMRYRAGIVPAMRLRLGTRLFHIEAVRDLGERRRHLECLVEEREP